MLLFSRNRGVLLRWLLSALSETAVAIPWLLLLYTMEGGSAWPDALPGAWLPLLVYLAAGLWEAGDKSDGKSDGKNEDPRRRIFALIGGTAVAYLLAYQAVPAEMKSGWLSWNRAFYFVPLAAYLWYQGARGAIEGIEYGRIFSRFSLQFGSLLGGILLLMAAGQARNPKVQLLLYWSVLLLFAAGLSLLLVTRERSLRADQAKMGEKGDGASVTPIMTGVVVGLTLLTLAASQLLSVERLLAVLGAVSDSVDPLFTWLWKVFFLVLARWLQLISPLLKLIIANLRRRNEAEVEMAQGETPEEEFPWEDAGPAFDLVPYLKAAALMIALLVLISWLYRLNRRRQEAGEEEEERISLGFWSSLWADLRGLLGPLGHRVASVLETSPEAVLGNDPRDPRALFRRLQSWGTAQGRPRREAETPNRYGEALAGLRPESEGPATAVTAVYNQARYGRTLPGEAEVAEASRALERLEKPENPPA